MLENERYFPIKKKSFQVKKSANNNKSKEDKIY